MGKKFLVTTATADERMPITMAPYRRNPITDIYGEEVLLNSDYAKDLPQEMYQTVTQTFEEQNFPPPAKPVLWVTTITRVS